MPGPNETIDAFVSTLRSKAKGCNFGDQLEKIIRDRIVFTCIDQRTKDAHIHADTLDLESAVRICRAPESARDSMRELNAPSSSAASVAAVSRTSSINNRHRECQQDRRDNSIAPPPAAARRMWQLRHATRAASVFRIQQRRRQMSQQGSFRRMVPRRTLTQSKSSVGRSFYRCCLRCQCR
jgi:hypothetical protein